MFFPAITCTVLPAPSNGDITYTTDTIAPFDFETTATYTCSTGFGLSNRNRVRICVGAPLGGGTWSGVPPTCDGKKVY